MSGSFCDAVSLRLLRSCIDGRSGPESEILFINWIAWERCISIYMASRILNQLDPQVT